MTPSYYRKKIGLTPRDRRIKVFVFLIIVFSLLIVLQAFNLQVLKHSFFEALASGQHALVQKLQPERGEIYVQDLKGKELFKIATNQDLYHVYAVPKEIQDPEAASQLLASLLDLKEEVILNRLNKKDDLYEPLKSKVDEETLQKISDLNLKGINWIKESWRFYPEGELFSHILGFVGFQDNKLKGQYGLEGYFEEELAGQPGLIKGEKDAGGNFIFVGKSLFQEAVDGSDLILTIDHTIQFVACSKLEEAVKKHGANQGSVVIMDPKTGAVLAMCSYPNFNPNKYNEVSDYKIFLNPSIQLPYEPGSVFKPITMAIGLELGLITPETTYKDEGLVKIGSYTLKNFDGKAHGIQTMTQVLEQSLNTGAIFVARKIGPKRFYEYVKKFGFGNKTGIELEGEAEGNISSLEKMKEIYLATASYGQGITVTLLQLAQAFSVLANGGKLVKPFLVSEIIKPSGERIKTTPQVIRQVISNKTATTIAAMMVSVVERGHGKRAYVPGYYVAGKTGTAQVSYKDRPGYDPSKHIGSFAGFAPLDDPKFVMVVRIDNPKDVMWAESSAAPLFGEIAQFLLNYFEVKPSRSF